MRSRQHLLLFCLAALALAVLGARASSQSRTAGAGEKTGPNRPAPSHDWPRFGFDVSGSNVSTAPAGIDATMARSLRRQQVQLDGTVDSSPIYLSGVEVNGARHDVFFVTTTYGKTLAVDANDGSVLWRYTPPAYVSLAGSHQITTATPVADPSRQFIYTASPDGHVRKLAVADGRAVWQTAVTRLPEREKIASALNFFDGRVIAVTGGYIGDRPPYQGHVAILDGASGRLLHVWNSLCSDRTGLLDPRSCGESGSAIWGRAGATIDPATGNILVATGNGRWDGRTNWGDAVIELDRDATRLAGNYTPTNTEELDRTDADLGSTSPVLVGAKYVVQGGKDGHIRVLSLDRMQGSSPHRGGELESVPTPSGIDLFTAPAVVRAGAGQGQGGRPGTAETWLFAADNGGTAAWRFRDGRLQQAWQNQEAGTSPVVAGGLLYVYNPHGGLRIYESSTGRAVAELECGPGHWNSPIVADGKIALPEGNANAHRTTGVLDIWRVSR